LFRLKGSTVAPAHLDGTLPGDFGFDPLGLGADPERLKYYQEAELMNARWAMMAVTVGRGRCRLTPGIRSGPHACFQGLSALEP